MTTFVVMDKLEELYYAVLDNNCFEETYKRGFCDFLGDLDLCRQESLLLALTAVQKLYQRLEIVECPYLRMIADDLVVKNSLMHSLLNCLGQRNQHVVFSATKAMVLVFQALPGHFINRDWIRMLFDFTSPGEEADRPFRKLYTMELLRKVVKNSRASQKRNYESYQQQRNKASHCQHEANTVNHTIPSNNLTELFLDGLNLKHVLFHYIPFVVRPNGIYSFIKSCQHVGTCSAEDFVVFQAGLKLGDAIHDQENVKRDAISGSKENDLVAFLCCVMEIVKYLQGNQTPQEDTDAKSFIQNEYSFFSPMDTNSTEINGGMMTGCCNISPRREGTHLEVKTEEIAVGLWRRSNTINQLCTVLPTLVQYLHYPRLPSLIFKKILEVLNQVLFFPSHYLFGQGCESAILDKMKQSCSVSFLSVFECCLLDKVPKCSGFVGFCGTEIKRFLGATECETRECTDAIALRTASLILFKSCFVVLNSVSKEEVFFQRLSLSCITQWCNHVLSLSADELSDNKTINQSSKQYDLHSQLVALFVDQDDDLVEVLLLLLLLYQEIQRSFPCTEIPTGVLQRLNPHLLFEAFVQCIEFDHSVLLDLLISSETRFLEYILQYLHLVVDNWKSFGHSVWDSEWRRSISEAEENTGIHSSEEIKVYPDSVFSGKSVVCEQSGRFHREFNAMEVLFLRDDEKQGRGQEDVLNRQEVADKEALSSGIVYKGGFYDQRWESASLQADYRCGVSRLCETARSSENSYLRERDSLEKKDLENEGSGLRSIVAAYSSSDELGMELEDKINDDFDCENDYSSVWVSENLDKIMSMLIRLRMSVVRLSRSGNFPYSSAPLITLMERVENFYDGC